MKNMMLIGGIVVIAFLAYFVFMNKPAQDDTIMDTTYPAGSPESQNATPDDTLMKSSVILSEQSDSGETGMVTMQEENGQVTVTINMTGAPATAQPAHIHAGACPTPGAVVFPLTNVVNGMSETVLTTTLAELKAQMPLAVNVHKSATESSVYVACGGISL